MLTACAHDVTGWDQHPTYRPMAPVLRELSVADVQKHCGHDTNGCVWRDTSTGLCYVYHGPKPHQHTIDHEKKHCAGYEHAPVVNLPSVNQCHG